MAELTVFAIDPSKASVGNFIMSVIPVASLPTDEDVETYICSRQDLLDLREQISNLLDESRAWMKEKDV